jgi:hypothetical protein
MRRCYRVLSPPFECRQCESRGRVLTLFAFENHVISTSSLSEKRGQLFVRALQRRQFFQLLMINVQRFAACAGSFPTMHRVSFINSKSVMVSRPVERAMIIRTLAPCSGRGERRTSRPSSVLATGTIGTQPVQK